MGIFKCEPSNMLISLTAEHCHPSSRGLCAIDMRQERRATLLQTWRRCGASYDARCRALFCRGGDGRSWRQPY